MSNNKPTEEEMEELGKMALVRAVATSNSMMVSIPAIAKKEGIPVDVLILMLHTLIRRSAADVLAGKSDMPEAAAKELAAFIESDFKSRAVDVPLPDDPPFGPGESIH